MSARASQKEHCLLGAPYVSFFLSILLFFIRLKSSEAYLKNYEFDIRNTRKN